MVKYDSVNKELVVDGKRFTLFSGETLEPIDVILARLAGRVISLQEASTLMHRYIRDEKRGFYNEH